MLLEDVVRTASHCMIGTRNFPANKVINTVLNRTVVAKNGSATQGLASSRPNWYTRGQSGAPRRVPSVSIIPITE